MYGDFRLEPSDKSVFDEHLLPEEQVLWTGRPDTSLRFKGIDYLVTAIGLIFGWGPSLDVVRTLSGLGSPGGVPLGFSLVFLLFDLFFALAGAYLAFGRLGYRQWRKKHTCYALTNKRALSLFSRGRGGLHSQELAPGVSVNAVVGRDGLGSIAFGPGSMAVSFLGNLSLDFPYSAEETSKMPVVFANISDAQSVRRMATELVGDGLDAMLDANIPMDGEDTETDPEILYLASPPRPVSLRDRLALFFTGFRHFAAWFLFGFGMVFFWIFTMNSDMSPLLFWHRMETATATITAVEKTGYSSGGDDLDEGTPVYAYRYEFIGQDGRKYEGVSYIEDRGYETGAQVTVEYSSRKPSNSRIQGTRAMPVDWYVGLLAAVFPMAGILMIVGHLISILRAVRLYGSGRAAYGMVNDLQALGDSETNYKPFYRVSFTFQADDQQAHETTVQTNEIGKLKGKRSWMVIYDPSRPSRAVVPDLLPGRLRIDETGNLHIKGVSLTKLILGLLFPVVILGAHGLYAYLTYFR